MASGMITCTSKGETCLSHFLKGISVPSRERHNAYPLPSSMPETESPEETSSSISPSTILALGCCTIQHQVVRHTVMHRELFRR